MKDLSYRVDTAPITSVVGADLHFSDTLDIDEMDIAGRQFTFVQHPSFDVTVSNVGTSLISTGTARAQLKTECERCLDEVDLDITGSVEGMYVTREQAKDLDDEEDAEEIDQHFEINLAPAILAAIVFEIPFVTLCDKDCKGLCAKCGTNLNEGECECGDEEEPSGPFSVLADLDL